MASASKEIRNRVADLIHDWRVVAERALETESSFIVFGRRHGQPVVLKVIRNHGDEWRSGQILKAFEGRGAVRVLEHVDGALLLERLSPGDCLAGMTLEGRDDQATEILIEVIGKMSPRSCGSEIPTVQEWAKGFERYAASGDGQIPKDLLEEGHRVFLELCGSQSRPRLLHGDLQHYNVLLDSQRGWLAIDPKGVIGELEYEVGAVLRNPYERPELFTAPSTIEKRAERFAFRLNLDIGRILGWGFAQAVLAAIWSIEDGSAVEPGNPWIVLADAIQPMLEAGA
jgi:streptomycin 6-kinase